MKIKIDSLALIRILRNDWKRMAAWLFAAAVVGIVVAFSIPRIYKSEVLLAPETTSGNMASSISSLASMVGLYGNNNMTGDAIYPEIYPEVVGAMRFRMGMFDVPVETKDGTLHTTYYDYLRNHQHHTWWSYPIIWLGKAVEAIKGENADTTARQKPNPLQPTREEYKIATAVSGDVTCSVDKKTSVISISAQAQDPKVAATIADAAKERLQVFITNYRTNKARQDLAYMKQLFEEARKQYVNARKKYGRYADANRDLILESARMQQEELENDMQLQYNIYNQVAQQLQMAEAKVQEKTPAFTVLQEATVPVKHANMPKIYILALFLLLGFVVRIAWIVWRERNHLITISEE